MVAVEDSLHNLGFTLDTDTMITPVHSHVHMTYQSKMACHRHTSTPYRKT